MLYEWRGDVNNQRQYNLGGLYVKSGKSEKSFPKYYWPLLQGTENKKVSHASPTQSALRALQDVGSRIQGPLENASFPVSILDILTAVLKYSKTPGNLLRRVGAGAGTEVKCVGSNDHDDEIHRELL